MLNISPKNLSDKINTKEFSSFRLIEKVNTGKYFLSVIFALLIALGVVMLMPWTQNIRAKGFVTTLDPSDRPQTIPSIIAGRIEKWFVQEGDFVRKGDTIIYISEVKDEYFDPNLLERVDQQIKAKELSVDAYGEKVKALDSQVNTLLKTRVLRLEQLTNKLKQAQLKVKSDSMDLEAAITNTAIAEEQFKRMEQLHSEGLKSLTDLETRKLKLRETQAKELSLENTLLSSKNDVINARIEFEAVNNDYQNKFSKAEAEKFTAMSDMYDSEALVTKLQNQYMNYSVRSGYHYIVAPQDGYITKAIRSGIGETVKEGEEIISIMPSQYELAVEMYTEPMDIPLVEKEQKVRIQFDGWPAVVFSGWPGVSYGTYGGIVTAVDYFTTKGGKYRVLIKPDPEDHPWPDAIRVGAGAQTIALLKNVPVWYEIWRKMNGFPPDFYKRSIESEREQSDNKASKNNTDKN